ncbi:MAG: phosphoribosylaminoimidazolesuccinocarboxamide synthase [archaeon]|nr:hypothetical protein [Nanoarchaeota archaeon]
MGSVKTLIKDDSLAGKLYLPPEVDNFGVGAWQVSGRFSVGDLKELIPPVEIENKAEALAMNVGSFFEWLADNHPDIHTCYLGMMDHDGVITDTQKLLDRGELSNIVVMRLAHTPESFSGGDLAKYRAALSSGELRCGVADVESIFRNGFPLGSSTFKKIFGSMQMGRMYEGLATFEETVEGLDLIRTMVARESLDIFPRLKELLSKSGLGTIIPNPGFVLKNPVYDTTTKFEEAGDRDIGEAEARRLSGLSDGGYDLWKEDMFPELVQAQIDYAAECGLLNIDGKAECVAYNGMPIVTDFACTPDENRLMIVTTFEGKEIAIPSNKEIQRAIFRREGIYDCIDEAKRKANRAGDVGQWKGYMPAILQQRGIDLQAVAEESCQLMSYAVAEVTNRILGTQVFETQPLESWVPEFAPYASRIVREK